MATAAWKRLRYRMDSSEPSPALPTIFSASLVVRDSVRQLPMPKMKAVKARELPRVNGDGQQVAEVKKSH
jgi:hypothetical protein